MFVSLACFRNSIVMSKDVNIIVCNFTNSFKANRSPGYDTEVIHIIQSPMFGRCCLFLPATWIYLYWHAEFYLAPQGRELRNNRAPIVFLNLGSSEVSGDLWATWEVLLATLCIWLVEYNKPPHSSWREELLKVWSDHLSWV